MMTVKYRVETSINGGEGKSAEILNVAHTCL